MHWQSGSKSLQNVHGENNYVAGPGAIQHIHPRESGSSGRRSPVVPRDGTQEVAGDCSVNHDIISTVTKNGEALNSWKFIARRLEVPEYKINDIELTNPSIMERLYQAILKWKELKGRHATKNALIRALLEEDCKQCADDLKNYIP
ncbi:hypothetical protein ScPMuIL_004372 [Solemya velum]